MTAVRRALRAVRSALPRSRVVVQNITLNVAPGALPTVEQLQRMQRQAEMLGG